ncbi:MAG TPA: CAP domain-containing protein [Gaiellaceae bacterium]|jgi:uncharacterized protein YkwD
MPSRQHFLNVCGIVLAAQILAASAATAAVSPTEAQLLAAVNQARTDHGLSPLRVDPRLERAARSHSSEMMRTDSFSHGAFANRLRVFRARGTVFGENLAWGMRVAAETIVAGWLSSPEHRANMLRPGFRRVGIGVMTGRFLGHSDVMLVTADFGGN